MGCSNSFSGSVISSVMSLSSSFGHTTFDRPESHGPFRLVKQESFLHVALRISLSSIIRISAACSDLCSSVFFFIRLQRKSILCGKAFRLI